MKELHFISSFLCRRITPENNGEGRGIQTRRLPIHNLRSPPLPTTPGLWSQTLPPACLHLPCPETVSLGVTRFSCFAYVKNKTRHHRHPSFAMSKPVMLTDNQAWLLRRLHFLFLRLQAAASSQIMKARTLFFFAFSSGCLLADKEGPDFETHYSLSLSLMRFYYQ